MDGRLISCTRVSFACVHKHARLWGFQERHSGCQAFPHLVLARHSFLTRKIYSAHLYACNPTILTISILLSARSGGRSYHTAPQQPAMSAPPRNLGNWSRPCCFELDQHQARCQALEGQLNSSPHPSIVLTLAVTLGPGKWPACLQHPAA